MRFEDGQKLIIRSNEDEPYQIGHIVGYDTGLDNCPDDVPLVKIGDEELICFSIHVPYDKDLTARLDTLTPEQQYDFLWAIRENDTGKKFIIVRGLPGSGKSTKAKALVGDGQIFSADDFWHINDEGTYQFNINKIGEAHKWNQRRALAAFGAEIPIIIIDNTNTTLREMRAYLPHIEQAKLRGYQILVVEADTPWAFDIGELFVKNTHNVPYKVLQKMYDRYFLNADVANILF